MRAVVERDAPVVGTDLIATLDEASMRVAGLSTRQRLERLQRVASERGLAFLALQAQLALQAHAGSGVMPFKEEVCTSAVTTSVRPR